MGIAITVLMGLKFWSKSFGRLLVRILPLMFVRIVSVPRKKNKRISETVGVTSMKTYNEALSHKKLWAKLTAVRHVPYGHEAKDLHCLYSRL